jgi:hypothetical protein
LDRAPSAILAEPFIGPPLGTEALTQARPPCFRPQQAVLPPVRVSAAGLVLRQHRDRDVRERREQPGSRQMFYRHLDSPSAFQPTRASVHEPDNLEEVNALRPEKFQS